MTVEQRKAESEGVTEDDVNEIKQDISALRCELIEILKNSGMNTSTASGTGTGEQVDENRINSINSSPLPFFPYSPIFLPALVRKCIKRSRVL